MLSHDTRVVLQDILLIVLLIGLPICVMLLGAMSNSMSRLVEHSERFVTRCPRARRRLLIDHITSKQPQSALPGSSAFYATVTSSPGTCRVTPSETPTPSLAPRVTLLPKS
jgi:hypothetical protein